MCSALKLKLGKPMLPQLPVPEGYDTDGYFRHVAREGLEQRFARVSSASGKKVDEADVPRAARDSSSTSSAG